jgi:WD40 repeat protein
MMARLLLSLLAVSMPPSTPTLRLCLDTRIMWDEVLGVGFSPDGKTLAAGSSQETWLWETATWQSRAFLPHGGTSLSFSKDGRLIALASSYRDPGEVVVWDIPAEKPRRLFQPRCGPIYALALSPDGKFVAASGYRGLQAWDVASGAEALSCLGVRIQALAFAPHGRTLATGDENGNISLWDLSTAKKTASRRAHTKNVDSIAFSQDGRTLVSHAWDGTISVYDMRPMRERSKTHLKNATTPYLGIAVQPDKKMVAVITEGVTLYDASSGKALTTVFYNREKQPTAFAAAFSPDGGLLAAGIEGDRLLVWTLR